MEGVLFDHEQTKTVLQLGDYRFTCRHDYTLGWSPGADNPEWPAAGAVIVHTGENEFYVAGTGVVITFAPVEDGGANAGILSVDKGIFENGAWRARLRLNGDQTHQGRHLGIPLGEYDIQRLELYTY